MAKKRRLFLFEVTQTADMIIVAEDKKKARELAFDYVDDAISDASPDVDVSYCQEVTSDKNLMYTGWDRHAIPYGTNDDSTVGEILDESEEDERERELASKQLPLLPGDKK